MKAGRRLLVGVLLVLAVARMTPRAGTALPERLTSEELWALSVSLSEPGGSFRSENLLSNERQLQQVIPALLRTARPDSVYLGVGPEQNFTYIAALKPPMAFIVDIRRGNLQLHLIYKALFELAADRVDFVARLFSRVRPPGLGAEAAIADIMTAVNAAPASDAVFAANLTTVRDHLTRTHKFPLTPDDLQGLEWILRSFYVDGPQIQYSANFGRVGAFPTYAELMTGTDGAGVARSFLASHEAFTTVKQLETRNLIVPVVGDFAGGKALRAVARYLHDKRAFVGAFYLSNVEQYLGRDGRWGLFCQNVASLPLDESSRFIRSVRDNNYGRGMGLSSVTGDMLAETRACPQ